MEKKKHEKEEHPSAHEEKTGAHHVKHIYHHQKKQHKDEGMDKKTIIMMVLVGLLVLFSGVQSMELMSLKGKLSDEGLTLGKASSSTKTAIGGGGGDLSNNLNNLPSMVGGC